MPASTRALTAAFRFGLATLLTGLLLVPNAGAHTLRPAVATLGFAGGGAFTLEIETNLEARLAGIGPEHADTRDAPTAREYDRLRCGRCRPKR
jgi:hypothetical protein